ncbi:MAG TPA: hypothetical protein VKT81_12805 [Bryobacteraceae bacterium]|nr:hypothetical protein [Bryobacteraceae bacterium]
MRYLVLSALSLTVVFAQGNVVFPGTGHAPAGGFTGPNYVRVGGHYNGGAPGGGGGAVAHPQHRRSSVVLYPVFYGNGVYDPSYYADQGQPQGDPNGPPSVLINQGFAPPQGNPVVREYGPDIPQDPGSGMRLYQNPSHPYEDAQSASPSRRGNDEEPTLYLIAFTDHTIVQALGYWMEGGSLHYVSAEHSLNQVSMNLVDRDLSQRLNDERGVSFKLPAR